MRTVLGWMAAMLASALLGAAVYQTVLSKPAPPLDPTATVETITREPGPQPTLYRTEVRTVVEPTPTVTVEERVVVQDVQVDQPRTANPAPTRTSSPRPKPRATAEREREDSAESDDSQEHSEDEAEKAEKAAEEASEAAQEAAKDAQDAAESDD